TRHGQLRKTTTSCRWSRASPRRTAPTRTSTPLPRTSRFTAASGSRGNTTRTSTSSAPRAPRSCSVTPRTTASSSRSASASNRAAPRSAVMEIVVGFLVFGIIIGIAAAFVVREAGRIAKDPPPALFDLDDAYDWVVEHLPDAFAATLTPDDVRRILEFQAEYLERQAASGNGSSRRGSGPVVFGSSEQIAYVLERATA